MEYPEELKKIAELVCGELTEPVETGEEMIQIDTGDYTSKENYDDLLCIADDIRQSGLLKEYKIKELEAEHDYQFITFCKIKI